MRYIPSRKILDKYSHVLVNFALGGGKGIRRGDVVYLVAYECAKPFYMALRRTILKSGGHVISDYRPSSDDEHKVEKEFYIHADDQQIEFFPAKYMRGLIDEVDHMILIISETDKEALKGIEPKKIMKRGIAFKPYMDWRNEKENKGKFTWTLALYGTPQMAREAGLTEREYWKQIERACFLNNKNPVRKWREVYRKLERYRQKLNSMPIESLHIKGPDADLTIKLGDQRRWMGGSGRNIPSFEIFTSPDWRGTNGWIRFNQPLYRYGHLVTGIKLEFKNGKVVRGSARRNKRVLKEMIAAPNADKVGEFSMTDKRFSHISKFMAETLYDENIGGREGNCHIALGNSYHDCYNGDPSKVSKSRWRKLGFNDSSVHTDIISTASRTITAYLKDGTSRIIYENGRYQF